MELDIQGALQQSLDKVTGWIEALIQKLPELVAAVIVLTLFWIGARILRRIALTLLDRVTDHGPLKSLAGKVVFVAVILTGLMVALGILNLGKTVTSMLAGLGIVGLALGFAFQDIAQNFMSGVIMSIRRPFTDGHLIETAGYRGVVQAIDLRATTLRPATGQIVRIPNADVYGNAVTNYSATGERRVDLECGVSYTDDLESAGRVALDAVAEVDGRDESREPELFWKEFGGSSVNFVVRFWIPFRASHADYLRAKNDAIVAVKTAFDAEGVGIPYPITTLDFDDVGGRTLGQQLEVLSDG